MGMAFSGIKKPLLKMIRRGAETPQISSHLPEYFFCGN
jgi:hypothetical protein